MDTKNKGARPAASKTAASKQTATADKPAASTKKPASKLKSLGEATKKMFVKSQHRS